MSRECKKLGEEKRNSLANVGAERAKVKCFKCDSTGHIARDCPRLVRNERDACVRASQSANKKAETVECVKVSKEEGSKRCEYAATGKVVSQVKEANVSDMPLCQGKLGTRVVQVLRLRLFLCHCKEKVCRGWANDWRDSVSKTLAWDN